MTIVAIPTPEEKRLSLKSIPIVATIFTFQDGNYLCCGCHPSCPKVLAYRDLEQKYGNTAQQHGDEVDDEKDSWKINKDKGPQSGGVQKGKGAIFIDKSASDRFECNLLAFFF